ncbi:MAG: hypothetical protein IKZ88_07645 [Neisseriaceae bacterium]|nr:hypothetical protein [Neisseriaceae bacterium]
MNGFKKNTLTAKTVLRVLFTNLVTSVLFYTIGKITARRFVTMSNEKLAMNNGFYVKPAV